MLFCSAGQLEECTGLDGAPVVTFTQGACLSGWIEIGTSCYQLVQQTATFDGALQGCASLNSPDSRLAWMETREEMCKLAELIDFQKNSPRAVFFWVGGIRTGTGDDFHWVEIDGVTQGKG